MPFRGLLNEEIVVPSQISDHQAVICPECRGTLYPRGGKHKARHFVHTADELEKSCSAAGGESDVHARCTALAVATLTQQFADVERAGAEITIDVSGTASTPDIRRADALVEFQDYNPYFGNGLIIEVQYKHQSKDIEATTHDYLATGYSVAWLTPSDFEKEKLRYDVINRVFQADDEPAYSVRDHDRWEFETRVGTELEWENQDRGCPMVDYHGNHAWTRISAYAHPAGYEYEYCWWCESRRKYDKELTRFVYDYTGILAPEVSPTVLDDAIVGSRKFLHKEDQTGNDPEDPVTFEEALANRLEVAPCRGLHGIHEWDRDRIIKRDYRDRIEVTLWECRHCPIWLLTNFSDRGEIEPYILFGKEPDPDWGLSGLNGNPRLCRHYCHQDGADFDYCPDCFHSNP